MLTPEELYNIYSTNPCEPSNGGPLTGDITNGQGTPFYMRRIVQFLKHIKYPCIYDTPGFSEIKNTGKDKIGLPFKFLQQLDVECFTEIQPSIRSGTSHSVRNACDIARACMFVASGTEHQWYSRMATEYIEHFGYNSLPDCLMTIGPDLIPDRVANTGRAPSTDTTIPDSYAGMSCLPGDGLGVAGAERECMLPPGGADVPQCRSCDFCSPADSELCSRGLFCPPCCKYGYGTVEYNNQCCKAPLTSRVDFSYLVPKEDINSNTKPNNTKYLYDIDNIDVISDYSLNSTPFNTDRPLELDNLIDNIIIGDGLAFRDNSVWIYNGGSRRNKTSYTQYDYKLYHIGILERKLYGGYANLIDNSGSNFYSILDDVFLQYVQSINNWDYVNDDITENDGEILRARTVSLLLNASGTNGRSPSTNTQNMVDDIKDLLWNGYGVLLFSNVGFPNNRDSQGLSYPDKIWYTTYTIIGYDDTKLEFNECVYVLSCPWGEWTKGGHPSWGPLPPGCFLVTESHLKCMLQYYPDREFYSCRNKLPCDPALYDCDDEETLKMLAGCGSHGPADKCEAYRCRKQQRAMGLVFAISLTDGFYKRQLKHENFYPITKFKEIIQERTLYYQN